MYGYGLGAVQMEPIGILGINDVNLTLDIVRMENIGIHGAKSVCIRHIIMFAVDQIIGIRITKNAIQNTNIVHLDISGM